QNATLALYRDAARAMAGRRGMAFVDLFDATRQEFAGQPGLQHTINGWYVYGGRRTWDTETFPCEYLKIRAMAAVRDRRVWDIAEGKPVPEKPDDSATGELMVPTTRFGEPRQAYSENPDGGPTILPPAELIKTCTLPPGFEMRLFADETRFPEIAKPVQLAFDSKGRLWVSTMPSYPQWKPGDPPPADKLVMLEDVDRDGTADRSTVFYDRLHCPTGFQFFDGGVLVMDQPRMLWLKDTDGDDRADVVVHVLDGFATEDTHHTAGAFEASPGGLLHMLEGIAMSTAIETPWGPFRNFGSSGAYVLDPRTWRISHFVTPGYGNPWCYVFNEWGQGICGDGTGATQHWDTPLSGRQYGGRKGMGPVFDTENMRPVIGSEYLRTRQFPDTVQDQFIYACVINMNGIPRWTISDDGAGYTGVRVRHDPGDPKTAFDLLNSTDKHFRPVDPQIGPDGALWFGDWANPLIGHMQYSQRDPNRDHVKGRIYRLVCTEKPLLEPATQFGRPTRDVLEQLTAPEWRTRYRARADLQARPQAEVLAVAAEWLAGLESSSHSATVVDRLKTEVLWLQQSFHAVDRGLLSGLLKAATPDARAAATRVLADERDRLADAAALLAVQAVDPHPRVRCEAVRGLSFFPTLDAMKAVAAAADVEPTDRFVDYTCDAALGANMPVWRKAHDTGSFVKADTPAMSIVESVLGQEKKAQQIVPFLTILTSREAQPEEARSKAMQALADMKGGNRENGKKVFRRVCIACHRFGTEGADFGPAINGVATRLAAHKLVESIVDPNAEVAEKYLSTSVLLNDGRSVVGLLVSETPEQVVIFDGKEQRKIPVAEIDERTQLKQSSMPDGLAATLSPNEFLDVITFLKSMK
ncbi:MAG: HEAT repeat domain-containing protein, partial [Planctomycetaceae bacterium]